MKTVIFFYIPLRLFAISNVFLCLLQNLYTVSFSKPGHVELRGFLLGIGTEISLSFSTLEDTGTILLAVGGAQPVQQQVCVH